MSRQDDCMRTEEGEGRPCRAQEAVQKGHNSNKKEQAQARVVVSAGYHRWRYNMTNLFPLKPPSSPTTTTSTSPHPISIKMVLLVTSDNEQFNADKDVVERSVLIKNMLEGAYPSSTLRTSCSNNAHSLFFIVQMLASPTSLSLSLTCLQA